MILEYGLRLMPNPVSLRSPLSSPATLHILTQLPVPAMTPRILHLSVALLRASRVKAVHGLCSFCLGSVCADAVGFFLSSAVCITIIGPSFPSRL